MSKTLTVSEDAYERLASRKTNGESFSDVIKKLTGKSTLSDLIGIMSDKEAEEVSRNIGERRRDMRNRTEKTKEAIK
ncbi:MAG: antitoxin VapB family protein [Candidatus Aenigmatarchaeota archaeon]